MAKKNDEINIELDQIDGPDPRVYELGFHLDGELAQEDLKKAYPDIREKIVSVGQVIAEGEPVKIPLAYTITRKDTSGRRDFNTAFFCWIAYETDGAGHDAVGMMVREDVRVIRFLDIRSSADEAKHSADMQEMFAEMAAQPLQEDEIVELASEVAPAAVVEEDAAPAAVEEAV